MKTGRAARPRRGFTAALAAGALLVLAMLAWALNPGPRWRVAGTQQADGNVLFDGEPVPAGDAEAMNDVLLGGTLVEWRGHGDLELVSPGHALLAIAPGTVVRLPAPPPRWFARTARARLDEGTLRFLAGPSFSGARFVVETAETTWTTAGGAAAITRDPAGITHIETDGPAVEAFARSARSRVGNGSAPPP